jgi:hypothetical protein
MNLSQWLSEFIETTLAVTFASALVRLHWQAHMVLGLGEHPLCGSFTLHLCGPNSENPPPPLHPAKTTATTKPVIGYMLKIINSGIRTVVAEIFTAFPISEGSGCMGPATITVGVENLDIYFIVR